MKFFLASVLAICAFQAAQANIFKDLERQTEIVVDDLKKFEAAFPAQLQQTLEAVRENNEYHFNQKIKYVLNNLKNASPKDKVEACYLEAASEMDSLKDKVLKTLESYLSTKSIQQQIDSLLQRIHRIVLIGETLIKDLKFTQTKEFKNSGALVGSATKALISLRSDVNGIKNSKDATNIHRELRENMKNEIVRAGLKVDEINAAALKCIKA